MQSHDYLGEGWKVQEGNKEKEKIQKGAMGVKRGREELLWVRWNKKKGRVMERERCWYSNK